VLKARISDICLFNVDGSLIKGEGMAESNRVLEKRKAGGYRVGKEVIIQVVIMARIAVNFRQALTSSLHFRQYELPKFGIACSSSGDLLSFCKTCGKQLLRTAAKKSFK
jgi:hypothetical protein